MAGAAENTTIGMAESGFEVEVLENYQSGFNCAICSLIINKATHGCERHVFCEGCIQEYLTKSFEKENQICPGGCRKQIDPTKLSPNFTIDMMINKLKSKCSFKDCSWTGDLLDLVQDHRSQCNYATIKCSRNRCGESFLKGDTEKHDKICLFKYLPCCYCQNDVLRMNKEDHETSCALEKVKCIYHEVGCNNVMCRRDVDKHEHDYQSVHMKLSFRNNKKNEKHLTKEIDNLKEKLNVVVQESVVEVNQLKQQNMELKQEVLDNEVAKVEEFNQLKQQNDELKQEVLILNNEVFFLKKHNKHNKSMEIIKIRNKMTSSGHFPGYVEFDDIRLIIKLINMFGNFCVKAQPLLEIIKAPNYDENHVKCFLSANNFKSYFMEAFMTIPCHWFDFTGTAIINHTLHVITFPIEDNQIEDFCCKYNAFTVQSTNNTMIVTGFPQDYKIKIVIDGQEREVKAEEKFNPFDTHKLRAAKFSGSACIVILQK